jgi:hypothetical protein
VVARTFATGVHRPPPGTPWFTTAYFHQPMEAAEEAREAGLAVEKVVSVEGPVWMIGRLDEVLADDAERAILFDILRQTEEDPALLAASSHTLTVARRPPERHRTVDDTYQ